MKKEWGSVISQYHEKYSLEKKEELFLGLGNKRKLFPAGNSEMSIHTVKDTTDK